MIKLLDIIKEGSYDDYGVGDAEFARIAGYGSTSSSNTAAKADLQKQEEIPIKKLGRNDVYKNPKNLENFDEYVRAIADNKGDLYVVQKDDLIIHADIAKATGISKYIRLVRLKSHDTFLDLTTHSDDKFNERILKLLREKNPQYKFLSRTK